jgi:hypothetical protein
MGAAMSERRCTWCAHYAYRQGLGLCTLDRPLEPCEFYQREPGADDDLETARERLKQREREIRASMDEGVA